MVCPLPFFLLTSLTNYDPHSLFPRFFTLSNKPPYCCSPCSPHAFSPQPLVCLTLPPWTSCRQAQSPFIARPPWPSLQYLISIQSRAQSVLPFRFGSLLASTQSDPTQPLSRLDLTPLHKLNLRRISPLKPLHRRLRVKLQLVLRFARSWSQFEFSAEVF